MKKIMKRVVGVFFAVAILFAGNYQNVYAQSKADEENSISDYIPIESQIFLEKSIKGIINAANVYMENIISDDKNFSDLTIGQPYYIYDCGAVRHNQIFYYPLVDTNGNNVLIATIMNTEDGWEYSVSSEMATELNNINYNEKDYIFFRQGGMIVAQNESEKLFLTDEYCSTCDMLKNDYDTNYEIIIEGIEKAEVIIKTVLGDDIQGERSLTKNSTYTATTVSCNLVGMAGQGDQNLCWAASVATVVNYIKEHKGISIITAKNVADLMNISYYAGGDTNAKLTALNRYGVKNYSFHSTMLGWDCIKRNIDNKYPILIDGKAVGTNAIIYNHAVTIYGYTEYLAGTKNIIIWDSALNVGKGGVVISSYNARSMYFASGSLSFHWNGSISALY